MVWKKRGSRPLNVFSLMIWIAALAFGSEERMLSNAVFDYQMAHAWDTCIVTRAVVNT